MKKRAIISLILTSILIFPICPVFAGEATLIFSQDSLGYENNGHHISYPGLAEINVNAGFSIPVKTVFFEYGNIAGEAVVSAQVENSTVLGAIPAEYSSFDNLKTGDTERDIYSPARDDSKLNDVIYSVEKLRLDDKSFLAVSILPVTLDIDNNIIFNSTIILDIDGAITTEAVKSDIAEHITDTEAPTTRNRIAKSSAETGLPLECDLVIITTPELDSVFQILSVFKNTSGISTAIALTDSIFYYYPGIDDAEKVRNYLIDFYNAGGRYVLLGGDELTVPVRYLYYYNTSVYPEDAYLFMPSDLYFADMDGDWDADGDGVWGEPTHDDPDLTPELKVGRLPVRSATAVGNYIDKLLTYLTDPGGGDYSYLTRSLFFSADQMRDYPANGQHGVIAGEMPAQFSIDTTSAVEDPSGIDPNPTNPSGAESVDLIGEGYGIIHIINHGRVDGFMVRSSGYGDWPASFVLTPPQGDGQGSLTELAQNGKVSFYYSLACKVGGYELDSLDGESSDWSLVERLISAEASGAVGMVANTRWGWVYSSYLLQQAFTRYLFDEADGSPVEAMYLSWLDYPFYRDLIYGQNYYGDPTLRIYTEEPSNLSYEANPITENRYEINTSSTKFPVPDANIILSSGGVVIEEGVTDQSGNLALTTIINPDEEYYVTAMKDGYTVAHGLLSPQTVLGADDEGDNILPTLFELKQNFPNPFNPATTIAYSLSDRCDVTLTIYNILGQFVWSENITGQSAGIHYVEWHGTTVNGSMAPSGVYFYRLKAGESEETRKMVLLR